MIGPRIRAARKVQNPPVSQQALAIRLTMRGVAIDRSAISRLESKERFIRDFEVIEIAKCLRIPAAWFFDDDRWDAKGRPRFGKTAPNP